MQEVLALPLSCVEERDVHLNRLVAASHNELIRRGVREHGELRVKSPFQNEDVTTHAVFIDKVVERGGWVVTRLTDKRYDPSSMVALGS